MRSWAIAVFVLFSGLVTSLAYAQAPTLGPEFQVKPPKPGSTRAVVAIRGVRTEEVR